MGDGHIDLVFGGGIEDFFDGADAFGNVADFDKHLMQFFAFCEAEANAAVARECAGTGQDKVADAGQTHHGFGLRAHGDGKAGDFGKAARY